MRFHGDTHQEALADRTYDVSPTEDYDAPTLLEARDEFRATRDPLTGYVEAFDEHGQRVLVHRSYLKFHPDRKIPGAADTARG